MTTPIYLETGARRVIAGAIEWPGWARSGKGEEATIEALFAYGPRYAKALPRRLGFTVPARRSALRVKERLEGDATTDFGAPSIAPAADGRRLPEAELVRQTAILRAAWEALGAAAQAAEGAELRKGPRGGGRELDAIVSHVLESDRAYLGRLWAGLRLPSDDATTLHKAILGALGSRARGEPAPATRGKIWSPRYFVRRSAWHALDHAWEIEDRA